MLIFLAGAMAGAVIGLVFAFFGVGLFYDEVRECPQCGQRWQRLRPFGASPAAGV